MDGDTAMIGVPQGFVQDARDGRVEVFQLPFGETICDPIANSTGQVPPNALRLIGHGLYRGQLLASRTPLRAT